MTRQVAASECIDYDSIRLWNVRLGHTSGKSLQTLARKGLLKGAKTCKLEFCEYCVIGKKMKVKFSIAIYRSKVILDYVHMDILGPTKTVSLGGNHYFVPFIDDYFRRTWVYAMRHKNEVLNLFVK